MSENIMNRREFVRRTAAAAALSAPLTERGLDATPLSTATGKEMVAQSSTRGTETEMAIAADWARAFSAAAASIPLKANTRVLPGLLTPPFSFVYDGRRSADLLPMWKMESTSSDVDTAGQVNKVTYTDPDTGLVVRVTATLFKNFPAVEWVMHFQNPGAADSPILEQIRPLDTHLRCADGDPTIHYAKGATCSMDDFMPLTRVLGANGHLHLEPGGGRSSSEFLPFFNVEGHGEGVVVAIGWSGEWAATYTRPAEVPSFQIQSGMALTHLKLHPGEEIRTPRILTLFWQGEARRGNNLLRQFILAHHRPSAAGEPIQCPITVPNWGETPAADHLENIRQIIAHDLPMDYYWIDAGWFGKGEWWKNPGDW